MITTLTLNTSTFPITSYNRYTTIDDAGVHSSANVTFVDNSKYDELTMVGNIHSLEIRMDGELVYSLEDISAKISNISEFLSDKGMTMSAQILFDSSAE